MKLILRYLIFLVLLSSSFDIYFNLDLGGFNVRTCYLSAFAFIGLFALHKPERAVRFRFLGLLPFFIWLLFILAFVGNSQFLNRNVGYFMWLVFNVLVCYALYQYAQISDGLILLRMYVISFVALSLFGILQFLLSLFGVFMFITMWWKINKIPRVNGLCYEPSYYASYLLIGFVFLYFINRAKVFLFKPKVQLAMLFTITLALFLSTSRMGILFMVAILVYDFAKNMLRAAITLRISRFNLYISSFLVLAIFSILGIVLTDDKLRKRYLQGTGLESTASHSTDTRITQMTNVYKIWEKSPLVGYSLGGIAPAIAMLYGDDTESLKKVKEYEGLNIFLEVLAASGLVGFLFFSAWLFHYFRSQWKLRKILQKHAFYEQATILACLQYALIAEFLILILSQNILRPYLWIAIGMGNAFYFKYKDLIFRNKESVA